MIKHNPVEKNNPKTQLIQICENKLSEYNQLYDQILIQSI